MAQGLLFARPRTQLPGVTHRTPLLSPSPSHRPPGGGLLSVLLLLTTLFAERPRAGPAAPNVLCPPQVLSQQGLAPCPRVPAAQRRGAHRTLLVAPKNVSREYNFLVEEHVLIYNIYIFIFIPVQSYHVMFNLIFLGRKGPGRKMLPGAFGSPNAALLSLVPLS